MKIHIHPETKDLPKILQRPTMEANHLEDIVSEVLNDVKDNGDVALKKYTARFDGVDLENLKVTETEIADAVQLIGEDLRMAIQTAKNNIEKFHERQVLKTEVIETMPEVTCWRKSVGIEKVGLYIPGGTAPLFSTILMLGVPAKIAGCREIVLCTPPRKDGTVHPAILYTAHLVGVTQIFKIGGSQAIAAMAYGTASVPKVYKIFGPGNQYVTAAKQLVNKEGTPIDMPAGPSEVLVCADDSAQAAFVAADLLSQAEHGADSQVVLVAFDKKMVDAVQSEIAKQLVDLPRKDLATQALINSSAIVVESLSQALDVINEYAPEHLILAMDKPEILAEGVRNAGSIFLGHYTPESVGDYASGTNHTLPTNGFAKAYSGVSVDSFVKKITFQRLTKTGLQHIGKTVELMAEAEELIAHRNAVRIRLKADV